MLKDSVRSLLCPTYLLLRLDDIQFMENRGIQKPSNKIESDKIRSNLDSTPNKLLREVERIFSKKSTVNFNVDDMLEYRFKANLESSLRAW